MCRPGLPVGAQDRGADVEGVMSLVEIAVRIIAAVLLGGAIGLERQWRQRGAGLRTNALVSTGATAFVALSALMPGESSQTRIAAQVVSGIGFLGAGVILRDDLNVRGMSRRPSWSRPTRCCDRWAA